MRKILSSLSILVVMLTLFTNCKHEPKEEITSIKVDPTAVVMKPGDTKQLNVSWSPETVKVTVLFESDKPEVATVTADGVVKALTEGVAVITIKIGSNKTACIVTVSKEKQVQLTEVKVEPSSLTLSVGETKQLEVTWKPEGIVATPTFVSSKPEVATVDDKGIILGVAEGKALITVTAGEQSATCDVTITPVAKPAKQQLPGLYFGVPLEDDEIKAYELSLGRKLTPNVTIARYSDGTVFRKKAYVGNLDIIPVVTYAMKIGDDYAIAALGTETIENCSATLEMLKELGFSNFETTERNGNKVIKAQMDNNEKITVECEKQEIVGVKGQPDTKMLITFLQENRKDLPPKEHACIADAMDFPSWDSFASKDVIRIKEFEGKLGFRKYNRDYSAEARTNLFFNTIDSKKESSNFSWVYYVSSSGDGRSFIKAQLNCVDDMDQIALPDFKAWLSANGFDKDFTKTLNRGIPGYCVWNKDKSLGLQIFQEGGRCLLQIGPGEYINLKNLKALEKIAFQPQNRRFQNL